MPDTNISNIKSSVSIEPPKQIFHIYDHVKIADDLGLHNEHFQKGIEAIVIGSYADIYGGTDISNYTLYIKGHGEVSWYNEEHLTLIENDRPDIIYDWRNEMSTDIDKNNSSKKYLITYYSEDTKSFGTFVSKRSPTEFLKLTDAEKPGNYSIIFSMEISNYDYKTQNEIRR